MAFALFNMHRVDTIPANATNLPKATEKKNEKIWVNKTTV